jgi:O-antigen/teichoic acid export membrane protein
MRPSSPSSSPAAPSSSPGCGCSRAGSCGRWRGSYKAIGLISTAVTLYALYLALVVILGRTGRTEFNFPAAIAGLLANIALNLILVPPLGIVGAGLALVASYLVVLALMYGFTQRLFPVPYEWGRLARVTLTVVVLVGVAELATPTSGAVGLLTRAVLFAAYPFALLAGVAALRSQPSAVDGQIPEVYEAERMDEDARA